MMPILEEEGVWKWINETMKKRKVRQGDMMLLQTFYAAGA